MNECELHRIERIVEVCGEGVLSESQHSPTDFGGTQSQYIWSVSA